MRTLIVLAAVACLINTAAMALGALARDPVAFGITYLGAAGTGYVWLALAEGSRHMMTFREIGRWLTPSIHKIASTVYRSAPPARW